MALSQVPTDWSSRLICMAVGVTSERSSLFAPRFRLNPEQSHVRNGIGDCFSREFRR
jgi:hypothetical protein